VYPQERPTAAEALYKLQMILSGRKVPRSQAPLHVIY
jgi:hypothetical protein